MFEIILLCIIFVCLIIKFILSIILFRIKLISLANSIKLRGGTRL